MEKEACAAQLRRVRHAGHLYGTSEGSQKTKDTVKALNATECGLTIPCVKPTKAGSTSRKKRAQQNLRELEDVRNEAVAQQEDKRR
jgi:hypothetical protein